MVKFVVDVTEINYGSVEVKADSAEEAREKAEEEYFNGNWYGHLPS